MPLMLDETLTAYTAPSGVFPRNLLILFCCLVVIEIIVLFMGRRKMFYPSLVWVGMFVISVGLSFWYSLKLQTDISLRTTVLLLLLVLAFVAGDVLFRYFYRACIKPKQEKPTYIEIPNRFRPQWWLLIILIAFAGITYWQYKTEMAMVVEWYKKDPKDFSDFLGLARTMATNNHFDLPTYLNQLLALEKCFSYVLVFGFIFNLFFYGFHLTDILLLVPLPIYFFSSILTTGRTDLIFLFCVVIFSIFFCAQKRFNYSFLVNLLLVLFSVIAGVSFVAFFFFANFNKYGGIGDFSLELFRYSGSAINALDIFLNSAQPRTSIFGQHTLYSIFSLLFRLGFGVPALPNAALPATMIFKISTNIYTVYLRWIIDYGFFASFLISFFWGLIYSYFFCSFESKQRIGYSAVVLAYLMYPVVFSSIEDGFIATYSFSLLYNGVYMYAAWILFTQRNNICKFYFASRGKTMKNVL